MVVRGRVVQVRSFPSKDGKSVYRSASIEGLPVSLPDDIQLREGTLIDAEIMASGVYNGAMSFSLVQLLPSGKPV